MPLKGRLGLETARVPQADRHGLIWLERGRLSVEHGTLVFTTSGTNDMNAGAFDIPYQQVSNILLGPGSTVTHDAFRLLARHQTGLVVTGSRGVRLYAVSMPFGPDKSKLARSHAMLWSNPERRLDVARHMYRLRIGRDLPTTMRDLNSLRGIEGARVKKAYDNIAKTYGVPWQGRRYDRHSPGKTNLVNQALNHAATAMYAASRIAVAVTGAVPQLGFIHETSGHAFSLDIADLFRISKTVPIAFQAAKECIHKEWLDVEKVTRSKMGHHLHKEKIIPEMIDHIKELLDDSRDNT